MTEQTPTPSEASLPPATAEMLLRHMQIHNTSWTDAAEFFQREGHSVPEQATFIFPVATQGEVERHAEKQGISYADAWRYFERLGYNMDRVRPQYGDERVENIMAERSEAYDPENRPPLPTGGFFDADPLANGAVADALKNFGGGGLEPSSVELQQVESTTPPMEPGEPEVHDVPDTAYQAVRPRVLRSKEPDVTAVPFDGDPEKVIDWVASITEYEGRVLEAPRQILFELPVRSDMNPVRVVVSEGQWVVVGRTRRVSAWWPEQLAAEYEEIPEGMTHALVPKDALVFAVPEDFTVKQMLEGITTQRD